VDFDVSLPTKHLSLVVADIVDQKAVNVAFETAKRAVGPVDILIQNAGYLPDVEPLATANIDEFMRGFDINVKGNLIVSQAFLANSSENPILVHGKTFPTPPC
jgi:NADP-dependent 3-hydroxy acid dehydrogenase YdfG